MLKSIFLVLFVSLAMISSAQIHTQVLGDTVRILTKDKQRMSVWWNGVVNIGGNDTTSRPVFRFYPNGDFSAGTNNDYTPGQNERRNGVRFNKKLGILEIGVSNNLDTNLNVSQGSYETSGLIVNSDNHNTINSPMISSAIIGDGVTLHPNSTMNWSIVTGEQHTFHGGVAKSLFNGHGHYVHRGINSSLITGISNRMDSVTYTSLISGFANDDLDSTYTSMVSGAYNKFSGNTQFLSGINLISQGWASTTLGSANVNFASLPPVKLNQPANLKNYPVLAIGNSSNFATIRSNALTMLYGGRTQINTTGYDATLSESDITPKAALEVVSNNSGILIPKLTSTQRNNISGGDLHNGLLLYNVDDNKFQYYNGSSWTSLGEQSGNTSLQSLTDGTTITWNAANGSNAQVTLGAAGRTVSISNPVAGQTYRLKITQGGGGTITTWPAGTIWPGGKPPVLSTIASAIDLVTLYYDGTNYFAESKLLYKPVPTGVYVYAHDAKSGLNATTHAFTNVPAGALLVLSTSAGSAQANALAIYCTPNLLWTKRVDASGSNSGDAEIYTAVFTAGGNIEVTSSWGSQGQASVCYVIVNQETTLGGATASNTAQPTPSLNIITTRANSLIIGVTSDWNAVNAAAAYRNSPTVAQYSYAFGDGTFYHYFKEAPTTGSYTMGLSGPAGQSSGTALIEIRGN